MLNRMFAHLRTSRLRKLQIKRAGIIAWIDYTKTPGLVVAPASHSIIAGMHQAVGEVDEAIRQLKEQLK